MLRPSLLSSIAGVVAVVCGQTSPEARGRAPSSTPSTPERPSPRPPRTSPRTPPYGLAAVPTNEPGHAHAGRYRTRPRQTSAPEV